MTHRIAPSRRIGIRMAAHLFALALAGCSTSHVSESWQCPLAQGTECASVAAADPAVHENAPVPVRRDPLYRVRRTGEAEEPPCDASCGPFAWLARLLAAESDDEGSVTRAGEDTAADAAGMRAETEPEADAGPPVLRVSGATVTRARFGIDDGTVHPRPGAGGQEGDDLREAEVIGRIWIAPFVDSDGIYREGHWVRAVLAPAGWRLP